MFLTILSGSANLSFAEVIADRRKVSLTKMTADNVFVSVVAPPRLV